MSLEDILSGELVVGRKIQFCPWLGHKLFRMSTRKSVLDRWPPASKAIVNSGSPETQGNSKGLTFMISRLA